MSGMAEFKALLARKNQRFVCRGTGSPDPGSKTFVAHVEHRIETPPSPSVREPFLKRLRHIPELATFYEQYGSARLYCDTNGPDAAFFIGDADDWGALKSSLSLWFRDLSAEEKGRYLPEWIDACVVFGEIPMSGNYLLLPMSGEFAGHVYEFEHDGFEFIRRGRNFDEFLSYVSTVDDALIQDILCHTRYSDGETEIQWMADKYEFDE